MIKKILLPIDLRQPGAWQKTIDTAVDLARHHGAKLYVVAVVPKMERNLNVFPEDHKPDLEKFVGEKLPSDLEIESVLRAGSAHREIRAVAEELGIDLIVMHAQNPRLRDAVMGSNAANVVLHSPTSVYVVR
jgi:nucleotide-binding universal stress UspA family protein